MFDGTRVRLVSQSNSRVRRTIDLLGIERMLPVHGDLDDAVAAAGC
jgi:hypothetical protein